MVSRLRLELAGNPRDFGQFDQDFTGKLLKFTWNHLWMTKCPAGVFRTISGTGLYGDQTMRWNRSSSALLACEAWWTFSKVGQVHRYLNQGGFYDNKYSSTYYDDDDELPVSNSASELARGLAQGVKHYSLGTCGVCGVSTWRRNVFDQKHIEFNLFWQEM